LLQLVNVGHKSLVDYGSLATRGLMDEIRALAEPLAGRRVLHLSATAFGGGVAEINYTLVPLMQDAGLEVEWRIIRGADDFFNVTKTIHNALQGNPQGLGESQQEIFRRYQELNARDLTADYDFIIVHDPQPVGLIDHFPTRRRSGSGAGTSTSRHRTRRCSSSCCRRSRATTRRSSTCRSTRRVRRAAAGIHLAAGNRSRSAPKNMALSPEDAAYIVDQFGIDVERPLLTASFALRSMEGPAGRHRCLSAREGGGSRGATRARRLDGARRSGGVGVLQRDRRICGGDPDIYILSNLNNVGSVEVNAFQVHSRVVLPEVRPGGLGLTVEGGRSGRRVQRSPAALAASSVQLRDGETGPSSTSAGQCAAACLEALRDPKRKIRAFGQGICADAFS
jgi:trehalose synthase